MTGAAKERPPRAVALGVVMLGLYPLALAAGWLPADGAKAPSWVLALAGAALVLAGLIMLLPAGDRRADALAGLLLMAFSLIGFAIALAMDEDGNVGGFLGVFSVAQLSIGLGSLMCFLASLWAMRRWLREGEAR